MGIVILNSFLLLYASIKITCINIRNGAKMELNNLSTSIYADTYCSQRETNLSAYLNTLYSSSNYTAMLRCGGGIEWNMSSPVMQNSIFLCSVAGTQPLPSTLN